MRQAKRVLLMHTSIAGSGHFRASLAVQQALQRLDPAVQIVNVDAIRYINPLLNRLLRRTYAGLIKLSPETWDYLYDNPRVLRQVRLLRELLHRYNARKLDVLIRRAAPDVIACTQAFPCGMAADYRHLRLLPTPLVGILTDRAPHAYWCYDSVSAYVVPSEEEARVLRGHGVGAERLCAFGIPIEPRFAQPPRPPEEIRRRWGLQPKLPVVLVMGGGGGLGPIRQIVKALQASRVDFQLVVMAGTNRWLAHWLKRTGQRQIFAKPMRVTGYIHDVCDLMDVAHLLITKPGGLTSAEALARGLPMVLVQPIPGQEAHNARFLTARGCAVPASSAAHAALLTEGVLGDPSRLAVMRQAARACGRPDAAVRTARLLLDFCA